MRELTKEESELISGGVKTLGIVNVHGVYSDPIWGFVGSFNLWSDGFSYEVTDDYYGDGNNDAGGGNPPEPPCSSHDAANVEQYSDELASQIARDIRAEAGHNGREFLAMIYRDSDGVIRTSALIRGSSSGVSVDFQTLGFAPAQVVGYVHNHPVEEYGQTSQEAALNRLPSDGANSDWATADGIVAAGANPQELTLYVLGPDNVLREYDYASNAQYRNPTWQSTPGPTVSQSLQPTACPL